MAFLPGGPCDMLVCVTSRLPLPAFLTPLVRWAAIAVLAPAAGVACSSGGELILATTTSTQDSGLLDVLVPMFEEQYGYRVKTIAVGSGQALRLGEEGEADVILSHSPEAEEQFMAAGHGADRRPVMHNDFVLVGPPDDPADAAGAPSAAQALARIASAGVRFISRGDRSGTHSKELSLWRATGVDPTGAPWYVETGQGMGATLAVANDMRAYTLSDRGTYLAQRKNLNLAILAQGDPLLQNVYHVIVVDPNRHPSVNIRGARDFAAFITSPAAQEVIRRFGLDRFGEPLFVPDAVGPTPTPPAGP